MTALRFQTGGRHQTSPASLRGVLHRKFVFVKRIVYGRFQTRTRLKQHLPVQSRSWCSAWHAHHPPLLGQCHLVGRYKHQTPETRACCCCQHNLCSKQKTVSCRSSSVSPSWSCSSKGRLFHWRPLRCTVKRAHFKNTERRGVKKYGESSNKMTRKATRSEKWQSSNCVESIG